eukprot:2503722-Rhodomonas_salina.1
MLSSQGGLGTDSCADLVAAANNRIQHSTHARARPVHTRKRPNQTRSKGRRKGQVRGGVRGR